MDTTCHILYRLGRSGEEVGPTPRGPTGPSLPFAAAATALGLSQPTVTTRIRALERRLDQQLFQRLPRGATSTSVAEVRKHLLTLAALW